MSNLNDFVIENGVLKKYVGRGGDVIIPEGVKEIGRRAFEGCEKLTGVTFPKTLRKIGARAFEDCDRLTEIVIPEGVTKIEKFAFSACEKVSRLVLPSTLRTVEEWAFQNLAVEEIILPEGVDIVQPSAFAGCSRAKRIVIPASLYGFSLSNFIERTEKLERFEVAPDNPELMSLDGVLFSKDGSTLICFPTGRKGDYSIPDGVKAIGVDAFAECEKLTGVTFPDGVTEIADQAFYGCKRLTKVTLPASLRTLGRDAFSFCSKLKTVTLPEGLESIGERAFADCVKLVAEISIPDSVTNIGQGAFRETACLIRTSHWTQMLADTLDYSNGRKGGNAVRLLTDDPISVFPANRRKQALLGFVEEKGTDFSTERAKSYLDYARKNVGKLLETAFAYPKLLHFLCEHCLIQARDIDAYTAEVEKRGDTELKALLLDVQNRIGTDMVAKARARTEKSIEDYSDALVERIAARDPAKGIEGMTFVVTGKLKWWNRAEVKEYLERYGAMLGSSVTKKTDYLVTNDTSSGSEIIKKAKEYGALVISEAEFNEMIGRHFRDAEQINIPLWLKDIPGFAFLGCDSLTSVVIPEGVTSIGSAAFCWRRSLTRVTIPASVTSIGNRAFDDCPKLTIYAPAGSFAEQYAKENNIPFVAE